MNRILVIDDELGISELICEVLQQADCVVETAFNGHEGTRRFEASVFDLVVTDMGLPDMDGKEVIRYIRNSCRPYTPIIGISGTPWLLSGADCDVALPKPFPLGVLIDNVKRLTNVNFTGIAPSSRLPFNDQPVV